MKRIPLDQYNSRIHRERDLGALSRLALLLLLGVTLTAGFLLAAGQHFAAIEYGYRSEELRREEQRLLTEQRRLLLAKEEAFSPARLEPAARQLGLRPITPGQVTAKKDEKRNDAHPVVPVSPAPTRR